MPKSKFPATLLSCDICDFKVSNRYIFKRHMHRCLTIHGIASKSSTSRNPLRLKGTEGLLCKDESYDGKDHCDLEKPSDTNFCIDGGDNAQIHEKTGNIFLLCSEHH